MKRLAALALALAGGVVAVALGLAALWLVGCAGEAAPPATPILPPVTTAATPVATAAPVSTGTDPHDPGRDVRSAPQLRSAAFGPGSVKPTDRQVFRFVASIRALRASPSGAKLLALVPAMPSVQRAQAISGVDPVTDGEWLFVYGPEGLFPGNNVTALGHAKAEADVSRALAADGGLEEVEGGLGRTSDLFGVREVLLHRPGVLALVPADRAAEVAPLLGQRMAPTLKNGELATLQLTERPRLPGLLLEVESLAIVLKAAADDGLDFEGEGECKTAEGCAATAAAAEDALKAKNTVGIRMMTANILGGFAVHATGKKLRVTVHATPNQVTSLVNLLGLLSP